MDGGNNNNKDEDEDGYILPMEDYNRLIHTEKFKRYFLDKRFQKVVKEINSADNRHEMLQENIKNDTKTPSVTSSVSSSSSVKELKEQCKSLGIKGYSKCKKAELIKLLEDHK